MIKKEPMFEYLESIAEFIPASFYWIDLNGRFINLNNRTVEAVGAKKKEDVIGKTVYELYQDQDVADKLQQDINEVIKTERPSLVEDKIIDVTTSKFRYFSATRGPLHNKKGELIGVIGTSIEITAEKEAEQLKIENEIHKINNERQNAAMQEQEKFRTIVKQVMHDITSPVSSINNIIGKLNSNVPEGDRVTLRNAATRISGISQKLLSQYNDEDFESEHESLLVSLALLQIMDEKREEHYKSNVTFDVDIDDEAKFIFIKHNAGVFKRMISNLINNAVDALKNRTDGKVTIRLGVNAAKAVIILQDNGYGMPPHIQDKFNQGIEVTEGKGDKGHGFGLAQVRDAIISGNGTYKIHATKDGTKITIRFPTVAIPSWLATEIKLTCDDTVVILDDDESIHGSWDKNFEDVLEKNPTLKIEHFYQGKDAVAYINNLTPEQKQDVFLLTDFELLEQGINGLEVVAQTNMHRAILVTSYSSYSDRQMEVTKLGIKMLPKELASSVIIKVDKKIPKWSKRVDMVWVEDQAWLVDDLVTRHYSHLKVDKYYDPMNFMEEVHQYPLDTRIILDTYYESSDGTVQYDVTGYDLARELHALGYTKLIIYTGEDPGGRAPEYLTVAKKTDQYVTENMDKL